MTNSEQIISLLSKSYFYEEFTFSDLVFTKKDVGDLEFSDTVVKFNDNLLFIQIKEKNNSKASPDKWLQSKVKDANKQHKDSLKYIQENPKVSFINNKQNTIELGNLNGINPLFITIFDNTEVEDYSKIYKSKEIGIYNVFSKEDFTTICEKLITPMEIINYMKFRIEFYTKYNSTFIMKEFDNETQMISVQDEESLISAYLWETYNENIEISHNCEFFRYILGNYQSKIYNDGQDNYMTIIEKFMDLNRKEIYELTNRIIYQVENPCKNLRFMIIGDMGILTVSNKEFIQKRSSLMLKDFKYIKKLEKAMLIEVIKTKESIDIMWIYSEYPYQYDEEEEKYAKEFEKLLFPGKTINN